MGKKRNQSSPQSGDSPLTKKQKTSNPASLLSLGSNTTTATESNFQQNGNNLHAAASKVSAAKVWLSRECRHLQELRNDPELQDACCSLAGIVYTESAVAWSKDLEALQATFKPDLSPRKDVKEYKGHGSRSPPPPPEILDANLAQQTFTHRSVVKESDSLHSNNSDYERLEFIGDSYLYPICAQFVSEHYPNATPGKLATIRQDLLQNESLAHFSQLYGFEKRLRISQDARDTMKRNRKSWTKVLGDIFEAYVAAVILSRPEDGWTVTEQWLRTLWASYLPGKELVNPSNKLSKKELSLKVQSRLIKLDYEETKPPRPVGPGRIEFTIGAFLTGWGWHHVLLGEGKGLSKAEAGAAAAETALQNPLTEKINDVKKSFDLLKKQEFEREGGPRKEMLEALDKKWK